MSPAQIMQQNEAAYQRQRVYEEGLFARVDEATAKDNPYPEGSEKHDTWYQGWFDAAIEFGDHRI